MTQYTYPTLFALLSDVSAGRGASVGAGGKSAIDGLDPESFVHREGKQLLTPAQLLGVRVPVQRVRNGGIRGYQRAFTPLKARRLARWILANPDAYLKKLPIIEVSVDETDGRGNAFFTDGQHRAGGAVLARLPFHVLVTHRTEEEAKALFTNQAKQTRVNRNVLILDGCGAYDLYLQEAVTDPTGEHPWQHLVTSSQSGSSKTRMSITSALGLLVIYVGRNRETVARVDQNGGIIFDEQAAHELATLISVFGTRVTNPGAYRAPALRALAMTAAKVFRDEEKPPKLPEDWERWMRVMPRFNFDAYLRFSSAIELAEKLVQHWNRHLSEDRKIVL